MQATEPNNSSFRRPKRSISGRMKPVVIRKMTYWMAEEYSVVLPVYHHPLSKHLFGHISKSDDGVESGGHLTIFAIWKMYTT